MSLTTSVPPFGSGRRGIDIEGRPARKAEEKAPEVGGHHDQPEVLRHRRRASFSAAVLFHETDGTPGNETTIINEKLATQLFANEDPIGRRIRFTPGQPAAGQPPPPVPVWRTIVGITPTIRHSNPQDAEPPAVMYVPHRQNPPSGASILVRSRLDVGAVMNAVRAEVGAVDPDQPVFTAQTMRADARAADVAVPRLREPVRDLRGDRAGDVGGGALRRDGVLRHAADDGDRRADGARRARAVRCRG